MTQRRKFYVVWEGRNPGIYDNWTDAQEQIDHFPGAKYKSYDDIDDATAAFRGDPREQLGLIRALIQRKPDYNPLAPRDYTTLPEIGRAHV